MNRQAAAGPARTPSPVGSVLHATAAKLLLAAYRVRAVGSENIPAGAAILSGNHVSYLDAVLLWCVSRRPVSFMAKSELWNIRLLAWALPLIWAFPVRRGLADRDAIAKATRLLDAGELVGIFPEGTRRRQGLGDAHGGAAFIAMRASAPIVPVGIAGTERIMPEGAHVPRFPRVVLSFGAPIRPEDYPSDERKRQMEAMTADLMARIAEELERAEGVRNAR